MTRDRADASGTRLRAWAGNPVRHSLIAATLLGALGASGAGAAEIFEKVGTATPISPTGVSYVFPAAARGAGWTLAAPESRLGMAGSNPAFIAVGSRAEAVLGGSWTHRTEESSSATLDSDVVRFDHAMAAVRLRPMWLAFGYQNADHAAYDLDIFRDSATRLVENLDTWLVALAGELRSGWTLGGSVAMLDRDRSTESRAYQASIGLQAEGNRAAFGAAFKSEPFGEDRTDMLAPALVELDARYQWTPALSVAARFSGGWWNNTRHGRLQSPLDFGAGAAWQAKPALRFLAGVRQVRERTECQGDPDYCFIVQRDQGTFLCGGLEFRSAPVRLAVAVEDSHVNAEVPATVVTFSASATY